MARLCALRRRTRNAPTIAASVSTSIIAAVALITGETPNRSDPKIRSGKRLRPGARVKNDVMKSWNENVNASSPPARIAGASRGSVSSRERSGEGADASSPEARSAQFLQIEGGRFGMFVTL